MGARSAAAAARLSQEASKQVEWAALNEEQRGAGGGGSGDDDDDDDDGDDGDDKDGDEDAGEDEEEEDEELEEEEFYYSDELETNPSPSRPGAARAPGEAEDGAQCSMRRSNQEDTSAKLETETDSMRTSSAQQATHYNTVNDSWFISYHGIIVILPIIFNSFRDRQLEQCYQRYSHGQRQKSLIIAHAIDLLLKLSLLSLALLSLGRKYPRLGGAAPGTETVLERGANSSARVGLLADDLWLGEGAASQPGGREKSAKLGAALLFGPLAGHLQRRPLAALASPSLSREDLSVRLGLLAAAWRTHNLLFLFSLVNLLVIGMCACLPHRHLIKRLSFIALFTWFLMCLQNYLIFGSSAADEEAARLHSGEQLSALVSSRGRAS